MLRLSSRNAPIRLLSLTIGTEILLRRNFMMSGCGTPISRSISQLQALHRATTVCPLNAMAWRRLDRLRTPHDTMLVDDAQFGPNGFGVGDEVYIAGLFGFATGTRSNSPILRVGNLAMIPSDRVETRGRYGAMEAYLIEARSLGGLSGAPVFVRETVSLEEPTGPYDRFDQHRPQFHASGRFYILGIAQGHWDIPASELNNCYPQTAGRSEGINIGIAIVTPARKIKDVLDGQYFASNRLEHVRRRE